MASTKSINPKPTKRSKAPTTQTEGSLAVSSTNVEEMTERKGPQPVETLSQGQSTRPARRSQNGASNVTEEQIRERAYQLYLERGRQHGSHEDDWYRAELELRGNKR